MAALQVAWGGWCEGERVWTKPLALRFWPGVAFTEGFCIEEHDDTTLVVLGQDSETLYLLDSPTALRFLIGRHPPMEVDSTSAVEYGYWVARLSGELVEPAHIVMVPGQLPDSIAAALNAAGIVLPSARVYDSRRHLLRVWVPTLSPHALLLHDVMIIGDRVAFATTDVIWTRSKGAVLGQDR